MMKQKLKAESGKLKSFPPSLMPWQRWLVTGRNHFGCHEIGYFFGRSPVEAMAEARRRKGHLLSGLRLEAEARL